MWSPALLSVALPLLLSLSAASPAQQARAKAQLPSTVTPADALHLAKSGEVLFLPRRRHSPKSSQPFAALVLTRAEHGCDQVRRDMLEVERYPEHWPQIDRDVTIHYRTKTRTRYALHLNLPLAPDLEGLVEDLGPRRVRFHDVDSAGFFTFDLVEQRRRARKQCLLNYQLYQPSGKESGFVTMLRKMEAGVGDSAEFAATLGTVRGYAPRRSKERALDGRALDILGRLGSFGTAMVVQHKADGTVRIIGRRVVDKSAPDVLARIRDRQLYASSADFLKKVKVKGPQGEWQVRYFNGSVDFDTVQTVSGEAGQPQGQRVVEEVTGGDLDKGQLTWQLHEVQGGTDVQLTVDLDLTEGSLVLRTISRHDATIREAARMQMVLTLLTDHVGGAPLGERSRIARAP